MASGAKHRWTSWILIGVSLLLFVRIARMAELSQVVALLRARGPILALSFCPYLLVLWLDAAGWNTLLSTLGRGVGVLRTFWVRTSAEALHRSLPGGAVAAEAMKPYLLRECAAVPISLTTASQAMSKLLTMATQSLYIASASAMAFARVGNRALAWISLLTAVALAAVALLGARLMGHGAMAEKLYRLIHRVPLPRLRACIEKKERAFLDTDQHATELFRARKRRLAKCAVLLLGAWLSESLDSWISLRLLGVRVSYANVLSFEPLMSLIRSLAFFLPGALGVQDLSYMAFLRTLRVADDTNLFMAFVLLKRAKEVFWIVIGLIALTSIQSLHRSTGARIEASRGTPHAH